MRSNLNSDEIPCLQTSSYWVKVQTQAIFRLGPMLLPSLLFSLSFFLQYGGWARDSFIQVASDWFFPSANIAFPAAYPGVPYCVAFYIDYLLAQMLRWATQVSMTPLLCFWSSFGPSFFFSHYLPYSFFMITVVPRMTSPRVWPAVMRNERYSFLTETLEWGEGLLFWECFSPPLHVWGRVRHSHFFFLSRPGSYEGVPSTRFCSGDVLRLIISFLPISGLSSCYECLFYGHRRFVSHRILAFSGVPFVIPFYWSWPSKPRLFILPQPVDYGQKG
jgi:hypothetical protein